MERNKVMDKRKPRIEILDGISCKANPEARELILPYIKYQRTSFVRGHFGGRNITSTCHLITGCKGTSGTFYTGLLPRIKKRLKEDNIKIEISGKIDKFKPARRYPKLNGKKLRDKQYEAVKKFRIKQRGRIFFPTGYGKTITAVSIMSLFSNLRILFLCHTIDLLNQNSKVMTKQNLDHLILNSQNKIDWKYLHKKDRIILLSTDKSLSNVPKENWNIFFDFIIVDEQHHVAKEKSLYGKILKNILTPMRLGLTGTKPTNKYEQLVNEGLLGPTLCEITNQEGVKDGILAKPKINLIPIPYSNNIDNKCKRYNDYVEYGIIKNRYRNNEIVKIARKHMANKKIVLIIIENIEHGEILHKLFLKHYIDIPFIKGGIKEKQNRDKVKFQMKKSKQNIAICTKVWREGIDIPTINTIIYAPGLKEEKLVRQGMGRGQRTTTDKTVVEFIDFLDPYKYLAEHTVQRIQTYVKEGWM